MAILWMIISSMGFLLASRYHSSTPSLQQIFLLGSYVPDLALQAVKFNLIFIASLLKIIRFLLYDILTFLSINIVFQICD